MTTIVSLDFPWGAQNIVGAAVAAVDGGEVNVVAHAVVMEHAPPAGPRDAAINAFIDTGDALGLVLLGESFGPFPPGMPTMPELRRLYVDRVASALAALTEALPAARGADVVLIDVPLVPVAVSRANPPQPQKQANMRPVERAFQCKVRVPFLNSPAAQTNFARFQPGVMRGYRPGFALAQIVTHMLGPAAILESFPQLVIGALAEMANAIDMPPPQGLTHHKRPPYAGQGALLDLIAAYLGVAPIWAVDDLPHAMLVDGIDALLGLLPVLPLYGIQPPGVVGAPYATTIKLRNLAHLPEQGLPTRPPRQRGPLPAHALNCRHWIEVNPAVGAGIDDSGIFTLDLGLWQ